MKEFSVGRRFGAYAVLAAGVILMVVALIMDMSGSGSALRGPLLVMGMVGIIAGIYLFPTLKYHRVLVYVIFLFPLLFTFLITVIIPMIEGICYSFTDWDGITVTGFVGFANYSKMFGQPSFIWSILITFIFVFMNVILVNLIGFMLALLCTTKIKALGFFRASYFLPNLIGGIVLGYIWQFVFNEVLTRITGQVTLLNATNTSLMAIIIVYIWQYGGYIMLIYITGLTGVPADTLEAAAIDGANAWKTLIKIKLPMIAPTITICTFLTLTSAFKQFDVNLALTNGTGSVADFLGAYITNGTEMLALNIYSTAIAENNYAVSQAKAVLFFIILAVVSIIQVRTSNKKEVSL
ncbi:MAG: sugar ABC transporter permease [Lachnospiraceae bacterium]|jgi:ABC-type sugar transport system permease subunit|nr:sugar ABC transporter permease [Lachnospiraceae bacterium]